MEFDRRNGYLNENVNGLSNDGRLNWDDRGCNVIENVTNCSSMDSMKLYPVSSSTTSSAPSSSSASPPRYIEHHVTKLDTLAGIAIRYGVEVADIKRMNGLVTDLQMFALKTLQIPLPGRHPPSSCLSNGHPSSGRTSSEQTPSHRIRPDLLETFQSLRVTSERRVSPAMSSLQGYYGLNGGRNSVNNERNSVNGGRNSCEGYEMAVYSKGNSKHSHYQEDDGFRIPSRSSMMNPPLNHHRRSRSLANGFETEECDSTNDIGGIHVTKWMNKLSWQPQKSNDDSSHAPVKLLKEENGSGGGGGWLSGITGKGLALRTKAGSRNNLASEADPGSSAMNGFHTTPPRDVNGNSNSSGVRKSSSTSNLQDQDNGSISSIWSTSKWSALKPDLQAALGKPIFDGLPKPITGRKQKTALD